MPLVPMARAAEQAGYTVAMAAPESIEPTVRAAGLSFIALTESPDHTERYEVFNGLFELPPEEANYRVCREIFGRINTRDTIAQMRAVVDDFRPDIVVAEASECAGGLVAEVNGLPRVRVHPGLSSLTWFDRALADGLTEHRRTLGLDPALGQRALRSTPQLGYFPVELDGATDVVRIHDPRYLPSQDRPEPDLVYLTLGSEAATTPFFAEAMQAAIDGVGQAGCRAIVALGNRGDPAAFRAPNGFELHRWVDQAEVLARASTVVCHGGAGTVLAALTAGRPLVVVPLFADQPMNADRVAAAGAGLAVPPGPDLAERIAAAVREVRAGGAPGVGEVRDAIARLPGPDIAVRLFDDLIKAGVSAVQGTA